MFLITEVSRHVQNPIPDSRSGLKNLQKTLVVPVWKHGDSPEPHTENRRRTSPGGNRPMQNLLRREKDDLFPAGVLTALSLWSSLLLWELFKCCWSLVLHSWTKEQKIPPFSLHMIDSFNQGCDPGGRFSISSSSASSHCFCLQQVLQHFFFFVFFPFLSSSWN